MKIEEAVKQYLEYQKSNLKPQTFKNYKNLLKDHQEDFKDKEIEEITSADIFAFLTPILNRFGCCYSGLRMVLFSSAFSAFSISDLRILVSTKCAITPASDCASTIPEKAPLRPNIYEPASASGM